MQKVNILISTINDRIFSTEKILNARLPHCGYIVVHQVTDSIDTMKYENFYRTHSNTNCKILVQHAKGTGRSRNYAIQNADCELLYIGDDDIELKENFTPKILQAASAYPEADIFCFMICTPEGTPYKTYFPSNRWLNLHETGKVSNVELVIRKKFLNASQVRYDERFGLGTIFNTGEEFIFLSDAKKHAAKILFIPEYIAIHPKESSGKLYSKELIRAKGAMINRVYGWQFIFMNFLYAIRKFNEYKNKMSFFTFLKYIYGGSFQFYKYA